MHKLKIFTIALLILVISGCGLQSKKKTTTTIKMTTRQALKPAEKNLDLY